MKTTMRTALLFNTTMTGTLARMLDRTADVIGGQTMGIIAALMWASIVGSIITGTQRLGMIMVRLTMEHPGITVRPTMEHLGTIMVRLTNFPACASLPSRDESQGRRHGGGSTSSFAVALCHGAPSGFLGEPFHKDCIRVQDWRRNNMLRNFSLQLVLWTALVGLPFSLALGHEGHQAECTETTINALKADIQALREGEARTTASKELEAANQMMAKKDMEGCKNHIHNAMEATEK
jgi:hypothetical protein